jgi:hypothetical protein
MAYHSQMYFSFSPLKNVLQPAKEFQTKKKRLVFSKLKKSLLAACKNGLLLGKV